MHYILINEELFGVHGEDGELCEVHQLGVLKDVLLRLVTEGDVIVKMRA